jgi:alkanesulfonate monooxygenase SsuD/methylene tetrahydromethanopterin reductase-like flavin-dependent oxidoreductase (luciferase family)
VVAKRAAIRHKEALMHVGYGLVFQNPNNQLSDREVWRNEIRLAEMVEPMGFDSIWSIEHHFDDYTMCPDPVQFLTYMAGRTKHVKLGSMVVVLPWHDPIRVAEQASMLDHVSDGRFIFGIGRGLAPIEYDGFRIDQNEGRNLFVEHAELIMNALEKGYMEGGLHTRQPRREIRPFPFKSFKGRTYAAAVSPESMPIMARLGVGLLVIPQKPWEAVKADFEVYHKVWREVNGAVPPPKPLSGGFVFVDENADRAEAQAMKWLSGNYKTVIKHYEMTSAKFGTQKGYEFYSQVNKFIAKHGIDGAAADFAQLMPWGTPDQVIEKLAKIRDTIDANGFMLNFSYAGMPYDEAERNLKCFAKHVLPEVKKWQTEPLHEPAALTMPAHASA